MSGIAKGVKKVFKKVGSVAKKILPYALPIAAAVFTIGGALGIPAMAGGFGGAVSGLFGNSTLGTILGGAVTQAGYMGLGGMAIGGITGGKKGMRKGALIGQAAGAVVGGIGGAMSAGSASAASQASQAGMPAGGAAPGVNQAGMAPGLTQSTSSMGRYGAELPGQYAGATTAARGISGPMVPAQAGMAQSQAAQGITQAAQQLPSAGMTQGMAAPAAATGFKSLDPIVQASMITGLASSAPAAIEALFRDEKSDNPQLAVEDERRKSVAANYAGFNSGKLPALSRPPRSVQRFEYDPAQGRVVMRYA